MGLAPYFLICGRETVIASSLDLTTGVLISNTQPPDKYLDVLQKNRFLYGTKLVAIPC